MQQRTWTVAEAKSRLSEILRLASEEGPQRIGTRTPYIVVPEALWTGKSKPPRPLGRWLVEHLPRGSDLPTIDRREPERPSPFEA